MLSFRAWTDGIRQVLRAPFLILLSVVVTLIVALPFAVMLGSQLRDALANQPPIALGSSEIDADWWSEFRSHATGLAATFTPTVIGFAAPLDNLSAIADGTRRPAALAVPVIIGVLSWALLWGVALHRFNQQRGLPIGKAFRHFPRFVVISAVAAVAQLLLYLTIHPLLFNVLLPSVVSDAAAEPGAFGFRLVFYALFAIPVVAVSLTAEYARVADVVMNGSGTAASIAAGWRFISAHWRTVAAVYLFNAVTFAILIIGYGVVDAAGGMRVTGWRGVVIGQSFIVARIAIRLVSGASSLALFKALRA